MSQNPNCIKLPFTSISEKSICHDPVKYDKYYKGNTWHEFYPNYQVILDELSNSCKKPSVIFFIESNINVMIGTSKKVLIRRYVYKKKFC